MTENRRVVVTGIGLITPLGHGIDDVWGNLLKGQSGIDFVTKIDAKDMPCKIAAEVKDFDAEQYMDKKEAKRMDLFAQYAVAASKMALTDSGIDMAQEDARRVGVLMGSGIGGMATFEQQCNTLAEKGPRKISPFTVPMMIVNMAAGQVAIQTGAKGPSLTVVTACASGTNAIGDGYRMIQRGDADVMMAGGTEAAITPLSFASFAAARALSTYDGEPTKASRPFEQGRNGFVMGEGAAMLVLEALDHAQARNATIYAEVLGYGTTSDAYHITAPAPDAAGATNAMLLAINDAGLKKEDIDYINAHGTSTEMNDRVETLAIKQAFGDHATQVAISSTKSMTGHLLGAAGALEGAIIALAIRDDVVPPTINLEQPDPECDLDYVPNVKRTMAVNYAMSNSLGFGGHNASIVFGKYRPK